MLISLVADRNEDYFSEDFDENKNCIDEKLQKKLEKEERCAKVKGNFVEASPSFLHILKLIKFTSNLILFQDDDELTRYEGCKKALGEKLQKKCFQLGVLLVIVYY